ncbi:MAG: NADH-quinone oxidoreductase subunit NuoB [Elusimicrobia bacterium]|nr:NADH-quinone oxidoreductase subunit NuoB [Elusimicrobiota bacterium]
MSRILTRSIWVYHFAAAPCNNCDIEILDALTPKYDAERFGIKLVGSIRHADCMLLTGVVNSKDLPRLMSIYQQAPKPFFVIAVGTCALDLGIFRGSYNVVGPPDKHIPIDAYVPGCPPKPEALLSAVVKLIEKVRNDTSKPGKKKVKGIKKL